MTTDSTPIQPARILEGFELFTDTLELNTSWEVNRRIYETWRIFDPWPTGLLFHMAGPSGDDVRIQAVWSDASLEAEHMKSIGIDRFTDVVAVLANEFETAPPDMLPVSRRLHHVSLGPLAERFVDIGPDLDESAGRQLGTTLTAIDLDFSALRAVEAAQALASAGVGEAMPEDLILRVSWLEDEAIKETQLWKSDEAARGFVERNGSQLTGSAPIAFREIKRLAIASAELR